MCYYINVEGATDRRLALKFGLITAIQCCWGGYFLLPMVYPAMKSVTAKPISVIISIMSMGITPFVIVLRGYSLRDLRGLTAYLLWQHL